MKTPFRTTRAFCGLLAIGVGACLGMGAGASFAADQKTEKEQGVDNSIAAKADFYVSPRGNDNWSGAMANPAADGSDGPFATLARARDAVRAARKSAAEARPWLVMLRGGVHRIAEPLVFRPEDSGAVGASITYAACPGERPVLSGGRAVTGWRKDEGNLWVAEVEDIKEGRWSFYQLFVNGERRTPARAPNEFNYRMRHVYRNRTGEVLQNPARDAFLFGEGEIDENWRNLTDVRVITFFNWYTTHHWIDEVDRKKRTVWLSSKSKRPFGEAAEPRQRYFVENVFEELDAPGEWYLDRPAGRVYYYPMPDEDMTSAEVIAPRVDELLRIEGDPDSDQWVDRLVFRGISFQHSDWNLPRDIASDAQNHRGMESQAIYARGARDCAFEDCEITRVGAIAVWLERGCKGNRIRKCHLHDLGAGAIRVGEDNPPANDARMTEGTVIDNNFIHNTGNVFRAGVGVWITFCRDNRVTHNEICDLPYTGISLGWGWAKGEPAYATNNLLAHNHIHNIGRKIISDMGGVYTLGDSPGSVVRDNVIHDVNSYSYGGWGLYSDGYASQLTYENNLCYRTTSGGYFNHFGNRNTVRNNIFAFCERRGHLGSSSKQQDVHLFTAERNVIVDDAGLFVNNVKKGDKVTIDYNCYWAPPDATPDFNGGTFEEWQAKGQDTHSVFADPGFENAQEGDFRLKPDSPALALGFKPFDTTKAGLYGDPEWVALPSRYPRLPIVPSRPAPGQEVGDDFEHLEVGEPPHDVTLRTNPKLGPIVATDETAAEGEKSLKLSDGPGLDYDWHPHMFYKPNIEEGTAVFSFAFRRGAGADFTHEWRDYTAPKNRMPFSIGPVLKVSSDGRFQANETSLGSLPADKWIRFVIACPMGEQAPDAYELSVEVEGEGEARKRTIEMKPDRARKLNWLGFMSPGDEPTHFYLDDLKLDAK